MNIQTFNINKSGGIKMQKEKIQIQSRNKMHCLNKRIAKFQETFI